MSLTKTRVSWEDWRYGNIEVFWLNEQVGVTIGHPDYTFKFNPDQARKFTSIINIAIEQRNHSIIYTYCSNENNYTNTNTNNVLENDVFLDEYYLRIITNTTTNGFWLGKDCLLSIVTEITNLLNYNMVLAIMTT